MTRLRIVLGILIILLVATGYFVVSTERHEGSRFGFKLGLDLAGGVLLTYRADTSNTVEGDVESAMSSLRDVIERRVNLFGVSEPRVVVEQSSVVSGNRENRLIVELPGITDVDEAVQRLGETPLLEFRLLTDNTAVFQDMTDEELAQIDIDSIYKPTGLTGRFLKRASLRFGGSQGSGLSNDPIIVLEFNSEGRDLFASITSENVGRVLAIFLDGVPITEPVIQSEIPDGTAVITGTFTPEEAREIVRELNFGALPLPIELISTETVGASLGHQVLNSGVEAGIWGLILVAMFLILWYRLPGLYAVIALSAYITIMLALFKVIPVTLTAAGIAGFILSIGMAVDANVLIFERMKEELAKGSDLEIAIREGFTRAWASIRDSNLSSIITAVILFWFGTSLVEGFALTFGIGVLVSMLTAVSFTRTLMIATAPKNRGVLYGCGIRKKS